MRDADDVRRDHRHRHVEAPADAIEPRLAGKMTHARHSISAQRAARDKLRRLEEAIIELEGDPRAARRRPSLLAALRQERDGLTARLRFPTGRAGKVR
jgi:hypothetical protein